MKKNTQMDLEFGKVLRDHGMQTAEDHANAVSDRWSDRAYGMLKLFLQGHERGEFMAEQVREFSDNLGLTPPPSQRAWGAVITRAAKAGLITRVRYAPVHNEKAHLTPASVWRKA